MTMAGPVPATARTLSPTRHYEVRLGSAAAPLVASPRHEAASRSQSPTMRCQEQRASSPARPDARAKSPLRLANEPLHWAGPLTPPLPAAFATARASGAPFA